MLGGRDRLECRPAHTGGKRRAEACLALISPVQVAAVCGSLYHS